VFTQNTQAGRRKDGLRFITDQDTQYDFFWDYQQKGQTDFSIAGEPFGFDGIPGKKNFDMRFKTSTCFCQVHSHEIG